MGTRINILLDHNLTDSDRCESVLARLSAALPAALAVREYWRSVDPQCPPDELETWRSEPVSSRAPWLYRFTAPGSLFLTVTAQAACIRTGGRWRGFLSIEPLRRVHLVACRSIADSLGSQCLAFFADSGEIDDLFWDGRCQWECIEKMEQMWGPPQRTFEPIESTVALTSEHTVPLVWFLEGKYKAPI